MKGLGVFLTSATRSIDAKEARRIRDAGFRWAACWVESYDGRRVSLGTLRPLAAMLRTAGVEPVVWSFPAPREAHGAASRLRACAQSIEASRAILDIEDPDGARGPMDWTAEQVTDAIEGLAPVEYAITSYPGREGFGLPWQEMRAPMGMPQLYGTADDAPRARALREEWRLAHGAVTPITSIGTPTTGERVDPERLRARLAAVCCDAAGAIVVEGAAVWSWSLLTAQHRRVCREWAASAGW